MSIGQRRGFWFRVQRIIAVVALVAQGAMLVAPLGDVRDGPPAATLAQAASASGTAFVHGPAQPARPHNPATCPACIAQSLHAQLAPAFALPTFWHASRTAVDHPAAFVVHRAAFSSHHSRAPPVRS